MRQEDTPRKKAHLPGMTRVTTAKSSYIATRRSLAQAVAGRFISRIVEVQASRGVAHVVLTGGGMGTAVLAEVAAAPARDAIDWAKCTCGGATNGSCPPVTPTATTLPRGSRLLDLVPIDPAHMHAMPS